MCNKSQRKNLRFTRQVRPCIVQTELVLTVFNNAQKLLQVYQHVSSLEYLIHEFGHRSPLILDKMKRIYRPMSMLVRREQEKYFLRLKTAVNRDCTSKRQTGAEVSTGSRFPL